MRSRALLAVSLLAVLAGCAAPQNPPAVSVFDDENIETEAISRIQRGRPSNVHVDVASFNRRLLLTGEVQSEAARSEIEKLVTGIPKVRAISNELVVGNITGVATRTTDSWIASDVKRRLRGNPSFNADQVKVVTESGTVYLMGNLSRSQAAAAAEVASTTNRVARVILVFDYVD
jgi:osmotically-inducible protein OsmY